MADDRLSEVEKAQIALIPRIDERLLAIYSRMEKIETDTAEMRAQINKWRGAMPILIGIGGLLGWLLTSFDKIKGLFY